MKRHWETDELVDHFTLLPNEKQLVENKTLNTKIGFAVLLKYFQQEVRFPSHPYDIPKPVVAFIAKQLKLPPDLFGQYPWESRTMTNHRSEIRSFFDFREATVSDTENVKTWLIEKVLDHIQELESLKTEVYAEFRQRKIEPPTDEQINRMVRSAIHTYEQHFFKEIYQKLSQTSISRMDSLIQSWVELENEERVENEFEDEEHITFRKLNLGPGSPSKDSLIQEIKKLKTLRMLELPEDLFNHIPSKQLKKYRQRAVSEEVRELRRHQPPTRYALLAAFFWSRSMEITDNLVELFSIHFL